MKGKLALILAILGLFVVGLASAATINVPADQANITAAIANATDGDTISVADGTYSGESIVVDVPNLIIESVNGSSAVILDLTVSSQVCLKVAAAGAGLTLGGSADHGFTILCDGPGRNIELENAPANVEISYNIINTSGAETMGISVGAAGSSGLIIDHNEFVGGETGDGYIWAELTSDVTITDNTMTFAEVQASGYAIEVAGAGGTSDISGNDITNAANAIFILDGTVDTDDLTMDGNTITTCINGFRFYSGYGVGGTIAASAGGVEITSNTVAGCTDAIKIPAGTDIIASNMYVYQNNLAGNTQGAENLDASTLNATYNYWGLTGPAIYLGYVTGASFSPFYTTAAMTTLGYYPSATGSYLYTYEKSDLQNIIVDGIGTTGAAFISWVDLLILLLIISVIAGFFIKIKGMVK